MNESKTFKEITNKIENFGRSTASYWGNAISGEIGELTEIITNDLLLVVSGGKVSNLIKKYERDGQPIHNKIKYELADIFIYLELTARWFGIDLEKAIIEKINIVKERRKKKKQEETISANHPSF